MTTHDMCIIRPWQPSPSSAHRATRVRRRSTACSRIPALELYALGSDSLAGQSADALDPRLGRNGWSRIPRFITNEAALVVRRRRRCSSASRTRRRPRSSHRRAASSSISRARTASPMPAVYEAWYGFEHPRPERARGWSYGLPEVSPPSGRLIANPGCYATAALLALAPIADAIEHERRRRRREVGHDRARAARLKPRSHAGVVLENVSPYRVGEHQHAPEIASHARLPRHVRRRTCCRCAAGCIATCFVRSRGADLRALLEEHYAESHVVTVLPEGVVPELARVQQHRRRRDRRLRGSAHRRRDRDLSRSTTSARAPPARRSRTRTCCSASTRRRAPALAECSSRRMSVTAATGFVASGVQRGHPPRRRPTSRSCARSRRRSAPRSGRRTASWPRRSSSRSGTSRCAEPQAVVVNSGVANAATGAARDRGRRADRGRSGGAARARDRGGRRPVDRRDRRAAADGRGSSRVLEAASPRSRRTAATPLPRRSSRPTAARSRRSSRATASSSAGWRRAPG